MTFQMKWSRFLKSMIRFSRHCKYSARLYKYFQFSQHFSQNIFSSSDPGYHQDLPICVDKYFASSQEGTSFILIYLKNLEFILRSEYINFVWHPVCTSPYLATLRVVISALISQHLMSLAPIRCPAFLSDPYPVHRQFTSKHPSIYRVLLR